MAEYKYSDVITEPDDPRAEIGAEYYFGSFPAILLWDVSIGAIESKPLVRISNTEKPFNDGSHKFPCIIRKKEEHNA